MCKLLRIILLGVHWGILGKHKCVQLQERETGKTESWINIIVSKGYGNGSDLPKHGLQLAGEAEHELNTK